MARASLGSLVVSLGLDAGEYTRGLTKAEYQAKQFNDRLAGQFAAVGRTLGTLVGGVAIAAFVKDVISSAAALDDLAESTGVAVEELSRFDRVAKLTGAGSIQEVGAALERLVRSMQGADDETKGAGAAFKALGIQTRDASGDLRSAGQVMEEVAKELNKYEDGANKTAIAQAIWGKSGAQLLPFLKELANNLEITGNVTTKQAEEAEKLDKQWRALTITATDLARSIALDLVGALNRLLEMKKQSGLAGVFAFLGLTKEEEANAFRALDETAAMLARLRAQRDALDPSKSFSNKINDTIVFGDVADLDRQIAVSEARYKELQRIVNSQFVSRDPEKPPAPGLPSGAGAGGGARALAEQTSEAQRYLETLQKQLQVMQNLTPTEKALLDIIELKKKATSGLTEDLQKEIWLTAQQIESEQKLAQAGKDRAKAAEEAARAEEKRLREIEQAVNAAEREVESVRAGNEQLIEQIAFLKGGEEAVNRLTDAKLQGIIATKEAALATLQQNNADAELIKTLEEEIRLWKERQGLIGEKRIVEEMKKEAAELQDVKNMFADALVDPLTDFITGTKSAKEAFKDFADDIVRQLNRIAAQKIANAIFGGTTGGGGGETDWVAMLAKMAVSYFGGTPASSTGYGMNVRAMGGPVAANTPYLVGERGPEIFLPRGAGEVVPNDRIGDVGKRVINITNVVHIPPGMSRQTGSQFAAELGLKIRRSVARDK